MFKLTRIRTAFWLILVYPCLGNSAEFEAQDNQGNLVVQTEACHTIFREITEKSGFGDTKGLGVSFAVGDIDNDGFKDIYFTIYGKFGKLFHNLKRNRFEDMTNQAVKLAGHDGDMDLIAVNENNLLPSHFWRNDIRWSHIIVELENIAGYQPGNGLYYEVEVTATYLDGETDTKIVTFFALNSVEGKSVAFDLGADHMLRALSIDYPDPGIDINLRWIQSKQIIKAFSNDAVNYYPLDYDQPHHNCVMHDSRQHQGL